MNADGFKPMSLSKKTADVCIVLLTLILFGILALDVSEQTYVGISGYGFSGSLQRSYANIASIATCASFCLSSNCSSFNHNNVTKECRIHSEKCGTFGVAPDPASIYYKALVDTAKTRCEDFSQTICKDSGVYQVCPRPRQPRQYYCYYADDNRLWNVIQYRYDGSEEFDRTWDEYKNGFGSLTQEFWLGLYVRSTAMVIYGREKLKKEKPGTKIREERYEEVGWGNFDPNNATDGQFPGIFIVHKGNDEIHWLTINEDTILRIEMEDFNNNKKYAQYNTFYIDDEEGKYKLTIGGYTGTAGDAFNSFHNGRYFTTRDRDNDNFPLSNCARDNGGGYWYHRCSENNINAQYGGYSMIWKFYLGTPSYTPLKTSRMMVRKK